MLGDALVLSIFILDISNWLSFEYGLLRTPCIDLYNCMFVAFQLFMDAC